MNLMKIFALSAKNFNKKKLKKIMSLNYRIILFVICVYLDNIISLIKYKILMTIIFNY